MKFSVAWLLCPFVWYEVTYNVCDINCSLPNGYKFSLKLKSTREVDHFNLSSRAQSLSTRFVRECKVSGLHAISEFRFHFVCVACIYFCVFCNNNNKYVHNLPGALEIAKYHETANKSLKIEESRYTIHTISIAYDWPAATLENTNSVFLSFIFMTIENHMNI